MVVIGDIGRSTEGYGECALREETTRFRLEIESGLSATEGRSVAER